MMTVCNIRESGSRYAVIKARQEAPRAGAMRCRRRARRRIEGPGCR